LVQAEKTTIKSPSKPRTSPQHKTWEAVSFLDVRCDERGSATEYLVQWLNYAPSWEKASCYDEPKFDEWKRAVEAAKAMCLVLALA
jgi:hypothetical protein